MGKIEGKPGRDGDGAPETTGDATDQGPDRAARSEATHVFPTLEARGRERQATRPGVHPAQVLHRGRARR